MLLLALLACAPSTVSEDAPPAMVFDQLRYELEVDWSGQAAEGAGRIFSTDLGYRVALESLQVRTARVSLVECVDTGLAWAGALLPVAHAAHPWTEPDVSELEPALVEELVEGAPAEAGPAPSSGSVYCDLFWVLGPGEAPSVYARGWFQAPGSDVIEPFEVQTELAISARLPLEEGRWIEDAGVVDATVTLTRRPARAFDGLALEALSAEELAYAVGYALSAEAEVVYALVR